ncbi:cytochrome P450 [Macrolepiota fuliginosa MF-IS2]|uniref:Cytochrome P450 n=1 Tax=Macrolepiota fuliginosa MF-IS2 TaxID=1400762 RepID=A0A9P6C1Y9_9AGAR|nr:cytochrome P450 [Macrolepiota fuliginosa MF-IS2]
MISVDLCLSASSFLLVLYFYMKKPNAYSPLPLPPGPKGWPVIGNLLDMPTEFEWKTYHEWSRKLNTDILHVSVMGMSIIVLNSPEAVLELMECVSFNVGFMALHRRLMHELLHPTAALHFRPHEIKATHNLLERFLDNPNGLIGNLRYVAGETIMSVAYGLDIKPKDDIYIQTAEQGVHALAVAAVPGMFLVDMLPWLKYVPAWTPGAGFQKKAKAWAKLTMRMVDMLFEAAKKRVVCGRKCQTVFTSISLQRMDEGVKDGPYQERIIRGTGSDTTVSAITSCVLALLENPEILKRAQAELDSIVTPGHLPDFDDEASLPYITALTMETLRWRDVTPIAIPRYLQVDDEYKGSIVIPNAWAMLHDENVYPDPFTFKPERFLTKDGMIDKSVRDPRHACFGFGRRICPGRYMAFSAVWITLASIVYCFDIKKAVDESRKEIELTHEYVSAIVIQPKPFKCSIMPRSLQHERAIRSAVLEHESETAVFSDHSALE